MQQPQAQPAEKFSEKFTDHAVNGVNPTEQTADFVAAHRTEDVRELALKSKRVDGLDLPLALDQIAGWQIACKKLPQWASCEGIIYPPHISMEQCSSQFTAQYKSEIAQTLLTPAVTVRARMSDSAESDNQTTKSEPQLSNSGESDNCEVEMCLRMSDSPESDTQETKTGVRVTDSPESDTLVARSSMVDLTGGFGVDFSYLARGFSQATYVERQRHLCDLAEHNMAALGLDQARIVCGDGVEYLRQMDPVDFIYLDPARRDEHGSRTYAIEDCTPNVLELRDLLLAKSQCTLVKLSPMLDWRKAVADFDGTVREVHIVATGNECKELLLVLGQQVHEEPSAPRVFCVNDNQRIDYDSAAYTQGLRIGGKPLPEAKNYLYEPNASIMKAGCFDLVEERFGVTQVGPSSHLFVSATPVADFPGRGFAIEAIGGMNKKDIKRLLNGTKQANIAVRNFPLTAPQLRKKLKLADGGPVYLFGTTMQGCDHVLLRTSKI
ncbi:class I SAM-dependent methyltransferase [Bifidobacterium pseudocatenulatum]|uniref:THUMP-like domain-containing protein n=2 Tax=Bifidobacterium pseudocatenulatum TaxID=28026 RepID=UPI001E43146D